MLWPVVKALLGHYRRYPFQILLVWLGLTLGVSLLVGVTSINDHARQSYEHGEKLFSNPLPYRIRPNTSPIRFLRASMSNFVAMGSTSAHHLKACE